MALPIKGIGCVSERGTISSRLRPFYLQQGSLKAARNNVPLVLKPGNHLRKSESASESGSPMTVPHPIAGRFRKATARPDLTRRGPGLSHLPHAGDTAFCLRVGADE